MHFLFNKLERLNWCSRFEIVFLSLIAYSVMSIGIVEYDAGKVTVVNCLWKTFAITITSLFVQRMILRSPRYLWNTTKWMIAEYRAFKNK
jgi:hypothetical protein